MGGSFSAFQTLCSRLQENDPSVVTVNTDTFAHFDNEAAQQLSLALEHNRYLQHLLLDSTHLALLGPEDGVSRLSQFIQTSATLTKVLLKSPGMTSTGPTTTTTAATTTTAGNNNNQQQQQQQQQQPPVVTAEQRKEVAEVMACFFAALAQSETITEVVLADIDLATPCRAFREFLRNCQRNITLLRLSYGRPLEPREMAMVVDALAQNTTLQGLELTEVPESVWASALAGVALNETIHSLNLDHLAESFDHTPLHHVIETNTSIRSLSITSTRLGSNNIASLTTSLQRNETITELILSRCGIQARDAVHLKRLAKESIGLTRLNLSGNSLRAEGLQQVAEGLYRNRSLTLLDVSDNELEGREAARTLGNLLRRNRGLIRLDADRNNWAATEGMRTCAEGLAQNKVLTTLDMSGCRLNSHAMAVLAGFGLQQNRTLQVLALNTNFVSSNGLQLLLNALEKSNSVHTLSLNDNNLRGEGGVILAKSLSKETCPLRKLSINNNNLGDKGVLALTEALHNNKQLESLSFEQNVFSKRTMETFCRALIANTTLKQLCFTFHDPGDWILLWHYTLEANVGLTRVRTSGAMVTSPVIEAKLNYFAWRNICRPLIKRSSTSPVMDGVWAHALYNLCKNSKESNVYYVLRDQLPGHSLNTTPVARAGCKRRASTEDTSGCQLKPRVSN